MQPFLSDDYLLHTEAAKRLYHTYAAEMPIFDFHCHIDASVLAENKPFENITRVWLGGDHYKWRAMRINGIDESLITGDAPAIDKFRAWASTVENAIGNPLYLWTHLELKQYFDIDYPLGSGNADAVYAECCARLQTPELLPRSIVRRSNVAALATTDDPADDLSAHQALAASDFETRVLPTFRPDRALGIEKSGYPAYLQRLSAACGMTIRNLTDLYNALENRIGYFADNGCRASDLSLQLEEFTPVDELRADEIFRKALDGQPIDEQERLQFLSTVLLFLGWRYHAHGWVMQLHIGALRNVSAAMYAELGPDSGFDTVDDYSFVRPLAGFLSALESCEALPKTVLYNLNAKDSQALAALAASFCGGGVCGRVQYGAAWWFLDTLEGNRRQLETLAGLHLLPRFIGMLTDSRSLLSYPRHACFRRILCDLIGGWMEDGLISGDEQRAGAIVRGVSFDNAAAFFGL